MTSISLGPRAHRVSKYVRPIECFGPVLRSLERFVPIKTQGKWSQKEINQCLVGMAAERQSIHSMQNLVVERPSETSMRHHLKKLDMEYIMDVNYQFLVYPVLDILSKGKKCIFAIDSTDDPYYGEIVPQNERYVVGSRLKKSTSTFYRYISLYLIDGERKLTLSMLPARNDIPVRDYIVYFLDIIDITGLGIKALLLDREFYFPRQGPRQVVKDAFRFDHYRFIIWNSIARQLGFRHKVPVIRGNG